MIQSVKRLYFFYVEKSVMCIGTQSASYPQIAGTRDTSKESIVTKYELEDENKKKNAEIMAAKNKAKSLVDFNKGTANENRGGGTPFSSGSGFGTGTGALGMDLV